MKVLVTGGAGFIGSHYVRTLLQGGYPGFEHAQVTVLDKLTYAGNLANLETIATNQRFSFIRGDICDPALLATVVPSHEAVINFAAETHVDRSIAGATDFVASNVMGVQLRCAGPGGDPPEPPSTSPQPLPTLPLTAHGVGAAVDVHDLGRRGREPV